MIHNSIFQISIVYFILFVNTLLAASNVLNESLGVTKLGPCRAMLDDGSIIDLSSLDNPKNPRIFQQSKTEVYKFNPCSSLKCSSRPGAICETVSNKYYFVIGEQNNVDFLMSSGSLMMVYKSSVSTKVGNLKCICGDFESFSFVSQSPTDYYNFNFQSPCCCPGRCKHIIIINVKLSTGSVLLLIVFSTLAVYLISGVFTNKFIRHKNGMEIIPNLFFWTTMAEYIKLGFSTTINKIKGNGNVYSSI